MATRWDVRLLTGEAAAGIGKTTLFAGAVAEHRLGPRGRDVWLSLEPADSSASAQADALLRALDRPDDGRRHPTVADGCEAVWDETPMPVCLMLDDAHHLEPGSPGSDVIGELLGLLPANAHLVMADRSLAGS